MHNTRILNLRQTSLKLYMHTKPLNFRTKTGTTMRMQKETLTLLGILKILKMTCPPSLLLNCLLQCQ